MLYWQADENIQQCSQFFFLIFWQRSLPVDPKNTKNIDGRNIDSVVDKWAHSTVMSIQMLNF